MRHVVLDGDRVVARSGTLEAAHRATRRGSLAGAVLDVRRWQGLSKGKSRGDFDPAQLRRGTKVELEHTKSRRVAERIAMDHLTEDPRYYVKLARMERNRAGDDFDDPVDRLGPMPRDISFDPRCFERLGMRVFWIAGKGGAPKAYQRRFYTQAEADEYRRVTGRAVTRLEEPIARRIAWTIEECEDAGSANRAGDLGPPPNRPRDPSTISFDPRCFEQVGTESYWLGGGGGGRYPHRFRDEASANAYHLRTRREVTRHESPVMRRIAWTLADCPP